MHRLLKKQIFIKTVSLLLAAVAVISVFAVRSSLRLKESEDALSAAKLAAVLSAGSHCSALEEALLAASCCTSPQRLSEQVCLIRSHSSALQTGLSFLHSQHGESVRGFCSEACTAAETLLAESLEGGVSSESRGKLSSLADYAHALYLKVSERAECEMNGINTKGELEIPDFESAASLPSFVPVSEGGITYEEALAKAADFLKIEEILVRFIEESGGCFRFYHGESYVDINAETGRVSRFVTAARAGEPALSAEDAVQRAQQRLKEIGYTELVCVRVQENSSFCSATFAPMQGDVLLLTDIIETEIDLTGGEVTFFDASANTEGKKRSLPSGRLSLDVLRALVVPALRVKEQCYALIDTVNGECLTARFVCEGEGFEAEIFLNALTGEEEKISVTQIYAE